MAEFLVELIGDFILYTVPDFLISKISKLRTKITGKQPKTLELDRLKKRYGSRKIRLRSDFNTQLVKGTIGEVIRVIDEETLSVEFKDSKGDFISMNGSTEITVSKNKVLLIRKNN